MMRAATFILAASLFATTTATAALAQGVVTGPASAAGVDPIWASATMPPVCWIETLSASALTGQCMQTQTTALTLSLVTAGLTVNPFGSGASGLTIKVHACEPTQ